MSRSFLLVVVSCGLAACGSADVARLEAEQDSMRQRLEELENLVGSVVTEDWANLYATSEEVEAASAADRQWFNDQLADALPGGRAAMQRISGDLDLGTHGDLARDVTVADVHEALAWLGGHRIDGDAQVTIHVPAGTWNYDRTIQAQHVDGARIRILGAGSASVLSFSDGVDGLVADHGAAIGEVASLVFRGNGVAGVGVHATRGGSIALASDVVVSEFASFGVMASMGGSVVADGAGSNNNLVGFYATIGGTLRAEQALANGNEAGFRATHGGVLLADSSTSSTNDWGYDVETGASLSANDAQALSSVRVGFRCRAGTLQASFSASSDSQMGAGYDIGHGCRAWADEVDSMGNGTSGVSVAGGATFVGANLMVAGNNGSGVAVTEGSTAVIPGTSESPSSLVDNGGANLLVSGQSVAIAPYVVASRSLSSHGVSADGMSYVLLDMGTCDANGGDGIRSADGAQVEAGGATATGNGGRDFRPTVDQPPVGAVY